MQEKDLKDITVILPALNEGQVIAGVIRQIQNCGFQRIVVIDDGSTDDMAEIARRQGAIVIQHLINRGAGAAIQTAIELARMQDWSYIACLDADGQHLPEDILRLKEQMDKNACDLVVGSRFLAPNKNIPLTRRTFNGIANLMTNIFCKQHFTDSQSGLRLLNRKAIERIDLQIDGFGYCSEMLIKAERNNLKIMEVASNVHYSSYSISKGQDFQMGINTAMHFLWNVFFK